MRRVINAVEFFVGLRYLRARRTTRFVSFITGISMAGIALGVAALIVILSVMNGFEGELRGRLLSMTAHGYVTGKEGVVADWKSLRESILETEDVVAASPYISIEGMVRTSGDDRDRDLPQGRRDHRGHRRVAPNGDREVGAEGTQGSPGGPARVDRRRDRSHPCGQASAVDRLGRERQQVEAGFWHESGFEPPFSSYEQDFVAAFADLLGQRECGRDVPARSAPRHHPVTV